MIEEKRSFTVGPTAFTLFFLVPWILGWLYAIRVIGGAIV